MEENKEVLNNISIVEDFFENGYVKHNYDKVMEIVADDYIDHSPANARSNKDSVGILKIVEGMYSDMKLEMEDIFGSGDMVATRVIYTGVHTGECMGIKGTGRKISFEALENFKVKNGKIVESWGYWPDLEILNKLKNE